VVTFVKVVKNENDIDLVAQDIEALQRINSIHERGEFSPVILHFIYVKVDSKRWPEFKDLQKYFKSKIKINFSYEFLSYIVWKLYINLRKICKSNLFKGWIIA